MKLAYFPTPYPDELLYSVLARYHEANASQSPKVTSIELFGRPTKSNVLQGNLSSLIERLPILCFLNADRIIGENTLFPFFQPFLSPEKAESAKRFMINATDIEGSVHAQLGIPGTSVNFEPFLFYCKSCFENDINEYGVAYWHRIHQIPGVKVCPCHGTVLSRNKQALVERNLFEFIPLNSREIDEKDSFVVADEIRDLLLQIAKDVRWIMCNELNSMEHNYFQVRYLNLLKQNGLALSSGRVKFRELKHEFLSHYGENLLQILQSDLDATKISWLEYIIRRNHPYPIYPIRHVLMMRFLVGSVENFFNAELKEQLPFGKGPWFCLNPASDHYKKRVIPNENVKIHYSRYTKRPVGTFSCSCGFVYSRVGPDINEKDSFRLDRVLEHGSIWEEKFIEMVNRGETISVVTDSLGINFNKAKKKATSLKLKPKWNLLNQEYNNEIEDSVEGKRQLYRNKWLELHDNNPSLSRTELRKIGEHIYMWLHRNDKIWLNENSPIKQHKINTLKEVDWRKEDEALLSQMKQVINTWHEEERLVKKTKNSILKRLNKVNFFNKNEKHLTLCVEYLANVCESVEDFQIRRVQKAIKELSKEVGIVMEYMVYERANIKPYASERVKQTIKKELGLL